jgi:hypothetical protein
MACQLFNSGPNLCYYEDQSWFKVQAVSVFLFNRCKIFSRDRLCDRVVRVPGYRSRGPSSIPGATRFSEK